MKPGSKCLCPRDLVSLPWGGQPRYPPNYTAIRIVGSSVLFEIRNLVPRKRVKKVIKKEIIKENNNMLISDYKKILSMQYIWLCLEKSPNMARAKSALLLSYGIINLKISYHWQVQGL
jgi:hypothetical protein